MDELTSLRSARSGLAPVGGEALAGARSALMERIDAEAGAERGGRDTREHRDARRHSWLRRAGFAGLGTVLAGAAAAALVLTDVVGLAGWRGGADAAAASVLHEASVAAIETSDPVVGPGQYLKIETDAVYSGTQPAQDDPNTQYGWLFTQDGELYVPADRSHDWVWVRHAPETVETFGPESEEIAAANAEVIDDELVRAPAGTFYGSPPPISTDGYESLPNDPHRMLNHIYRTTLGQGPSPDGEALVWIADQLRTGVVPAEVRAVLYEAAALIPGVTITDEQANLDGRIGVAIGRDEGVNGIRQEIIIDADTGELIGEREVLLREVAGMPAGTAMGWTAVTTSVVDEAPAGGTQYGNLTPCPNGASGC